MFELAHNNNKTDVGGLENAADNQSADNQIFSVSSFVKVKAPGLLT